MAGAFSLFLGMLGLGAAGAVSAGQNAKIKKATISMVRSTASTAPLRSCKCGSGCVKNGGASAAKPTTHVSGLHRVTATSAEPRGAI